MNRIHTISLQNVHCRCQWQVTTKISNALKAFVFFKIVFKNRKISQVKIEFLLIYHFFVCAQICYSFVFVNVSIAHNNEQV